LLSAPQKEFGKEVVADVQFTEPYLPSVTLNKNFVELFTVVVRKESCSVCFAKLCLRMDNFLIKIDGFVTMSCMFSEAPFVVYIMLLLDHSSFSMMILDLLLLYSIMYEKNSRACTQGKKVSV
jgi:hypothetical protein